MSRKLEIPQDISFDFKQPLNRIQYIRKRTGKYNEVTRDFLDEIQLIQEHLEYILHYNVFLSLVCSGQKKSEWEHRLNDARDYLEKLETFPGMNDYLKSIEDELVKVANNLEEIGSEIHLVKKNHPLEAIDIYQALHIHQGVHPLHGSITEAWQNAKPEEKEYCERIANNLKQMKQVQKPERKQNMGQKAEAQQQQTGQNVPSQTQYASTQPQGQQQYASQPQGQQQYASQPQGQQQYASQPQGQLQGQPQYASQSQAQQYASQPQGQPQYTSQPQVQPQYTSQPQGQPQYVSQPQGQPQYGIQGSGQYEGKPVVLSHEETFTIERGEKEALSGQLPTQVPQYQQEAP
jgi:hypothetical protein